MMSWSERDRERMLAAGRRQQGRCAPELTGEAAEVSELLGTKTGPLPDSGRPLDVCQLEPDEAYLKDSALVLGRNGMDFRVRVTARDLERLRELLSAPAADGQALATPANLARWVRERHGADEAWVNELRALLTGGEDLAELHEQAPDLAGVALVDRAHAAGYRLADEDHRVTYQDEAGVRDFLQGLLEADPDWPHADVAAIERVRALLER
jgi:hypothetical protein